MPFLEASFTFQAQVLGCSALWFTGPGSETPWQWQRHCLAHDRVVCAQVLQGNCSRPSCQTSDGTVQYKQLGATEKTNHSLQSRCVLCFQQGCMLQQSSSCMLVSVFCGKGVWFPREHNDGCETQIGGSACSKRTT